MSVDSFRLNRIQGAGRSVPDGAPIDHDDAVFLCATIRNLELELTRQRERCDEIERDCDVLRERFRYLVSAVRKHWRARESIGGSHSGELWEDCGRAIDLDGHDLGMPKART